MISPFISKLDLDNDTICFSFQREGGYLVSGLASFAPTTGLSGNPDRQMDHAVESISSQLQERGWEKTLSEYLPGRISYRLACFYKENRYPQSKGSTTARGELARTAQTITSASLTYSNIGLYGAKRERPSQRLLQESI
jgi:hypothetical protein